jgi:hypothetical protein
MRHHVSSGVAAAAALLLVSWPVAAAAQAFTPPKGEGSVTVSFQDSLVRKHYFGLNPVDRGEIRLQSVVVDFSYGITDNLAVGVGLPWIRGRYTGSAPHPALPGAAFLDDGKYHSGLQDFRVDVRYNLTRDLLVITPYASIAIPSNDYSFLAHAAVGRQLKEVQFGVFVARLLDPVIPGAFVQTRFGVGVPEQTLGYRPVRSNVDFEVGYFVNESFRVFALGMGQLTHDGIDIPPLGGSTLANPLFVHHDQIGRENALKFGAGAALTINDRIDVFATVIRTVSARNGHAFAYNAQTGVTYSFGRRGGASKAAPTAADAGSTAACHANQADHADHDHDAKEKTLARCVCIKGS